MATDRARLLRRGCRPLAGRARVASAVAFSVLPSASEANSMYLAKLCRGHRCADLDFPVLDYSESMGACVCTPHPCWDENGLKHTCAETPDYPFLHFYHTEQGLLHCGCSTIPHVDSIHITQELCPGHKCETWDHPILDWDEDSESCLCRSHPCWNLEGKKHACLKPEFPVLRYREEETGDGGVESICECGAKMEAPSPADGASTYGVSAGLVHDQVYRDSDDTHDEEEF